MIVFNIFFSIYSSFKEFLHSHSSRAKFKRKYPTCIFNKGAILENVEFESNSVIFDGVRLVNSKIGAHTYIQKNSCIFNAEIGKFCSIASNVSIGPGIHKTDGISTHPSFYLYDTPLVVKFATKNSFTSFKKTIIGNDVWIGEKAIIVDGVEIGTGAIIAAGAVVIKNVEPYAIVGGVPAKIIKKRFSDSEINFLLSSCWWNQTDSWLSENFHTFSNGSDFFKLKI